MRLRCSNEYQLDTLNFLNAFFSIFFHIFRSKNQVMKLLDRVLQSSFFKEALEKGEVLIQNDKRGILRLLKVSLQKVSDLASNNNMSIVGILNHYVVLLSDMTKAYVQGTYRKLPTKTLIKILAVLAYFVSPFDFIPDVLPLIGFSDDLALVLWVVNAVKSELDEFAKERVS